MTFTFDLYMYKLLPSLWACKLKNQYKPIDSGSLEKGIGIIMGEINISVKLEVHFDLESKNLMIYR